MLLTFTFRQVEVPVLLLSATIPPLWEARLKDGFNSDLQLFRSPSTIRSNLLYSVIDHPDILGAIISRIEEKNFDISESCGIIYVTSISKCDIVKRALSNKISGMLVSIYHSQLLPKEKKTVEQVFMASKKHVLIATSAFGVGIDKPNVK